MAVAVHDIHSVPGDMDLRSVGGIRLAGGNLLVVDSHPRHTAVNRIGCSSHWLVHALRRAGLHALAPLLAASAQASRPR